MTEAQEILDPNEVLDDPDFVPSGGYRADLDAALQTQDANALNAIFDKLHVADIADIIEQAPQDERKEIISIWGSNIDPLVLTELEEGVRNEILEYIPYSVLARALQELDSDDLVYVIEDLEADKRETLLGALDRTERAVVSQSLSYPEESAGRLMDRDFVMAPEHWTAGNAIDFMRASEDLPEHFHNIFVVSPTLKPIGSVRLSKIMGAKRNQKITDLMDEDMLIFNLDTDQAEVAYAFNQYHALSAPVVDADGRIMGVIAIEDALEIAAEEAEEDIKRLAGVGDEELSDSVWETTKLRFPWLAVNLATSILASIIIGLFSNTIDANVALAILMPIIASMGGNGGTQTLTVAVRALATKDLTGTNALRIIRREVLVGLLNGVIFAVLMGIVGYIWFDSIKLGYVIMLAMVVNMMIAGLAGILIPIILEKLNADPALASSVFVTTVTDVVGFFVFLGLATLYLL